MTPEYEKCLQQGKEYEDFIYSYLWRICGIGVMPFSSKKNQVRVGENLAGIEIKNDRKFSKYGNLYIEVGEKANENNEGYYPAGILRNDNTWLYLIGNYERAFIFSKEQLRRAVFRDSDGKPQIEGFIQVTTPTSMGLLMPPEIRPVFCLRELIFEENEL